MVHYGFTREEVYFMPVSEMYDYIELINKQVEEENQRMKDSSMGTSSDPKTIGQVANNASAM